MRYYSNTYSISFIVLSKFILFCFFVIVFIGATSKSFADGKRYMTLNSRQHVIEKARGKGFHVKQMMVGVTVHEGTESRFVLFADIYRECTDYLE